MGKAIQAGAEIVEVDLRPVHPGRSQPREPVHDPVRGADEVDVAADRPIEAPVGEARPAAGVCACRGIDGVSCLAPAARTLAAPRFPHMTNEPETRPFDLTALLDESFAQWAVDARVEADGDGAVVRWGARTLHLGRQRNGKGGGAPWTLDGEPLVSVLEGLRSLRIALDPDFVPMRLRISAPPPRVAPPARRPEGAGGGGGAGAGAGAGGADAIDGRLRVHVLTGFLGSGKTTVLNRLLREEGLRDTAVVVNEFGAIGIDHLLVESSDDAVVELAGGCLCCTVRGDLALTLNDLVARRQAGACAPFSRILIETSGLADPTPVESLLLADPVLAERLEFAGVSACVDATTGDSALRRYREAVRQVALADRLILTKTDLAAVPADLDERLRRINPGAERVIADFGRVHAADGAAPSALPARRRSGEASPAMPEEPIRHAEGIDTFVLVRPDPIPGAALTLFLRSLVEHAGARLLRLKGFVELAEAPGRPVTVNGAGHVFEPVEPRAGWPDPDHRSRLVLIGESISAAWCERLLDALVMEVRQAARRLAPPRS